VPQAQSRAELLANIQAIPSQAIQLAEQARKLYQACGSAAGIQISTLLCAFQAQLQSSSTLELLRLVRVICSVLNKGAIKGFELVSLRNLSDTRCSHVKANLLDYVAFVCPRAGIDLTAAALEASRSVPHGSVSIEVRCLGSRLLGLDNRHAGGSGRFGTAQAPDPEEP